MNQSHITFEVITREVAGLARVVISVLPDGVIRVLLPMGFRHE